uniref:C2H2-type domain-containing protein n=1 Tax=Anopheles atroparvus TaxID=41427 RepID=A0A182J3I2_ANOAO
MHIAMALLLNICKYKGCAQIFQTLIDLIHHIEETHIIALVPLPERSQPACLPLSCILPYNPPCETVAPAVGASAAVNGASDPAHRNKSGAATVWASAALGATMTSVGGNATNNQPAEMLTGNSATATTNAVNGSGHGMPGVSANGTGEQNGLGGASGTPSETSKTTTINQPTGTADLKRKIAIKHHSYSISSSNRSTTPTGSELDDDDMMVSESEDSNDSWTTEEFSSEFIMRYGSRRHSSSGAGNGPNSSNEKPFACPVPGCKKRYKNVNGIKYHSKNGHKKDGNQNGTNASNTTTSPPPLPPPTATLASATSSGQASFTIAAQATTKRTLPSSSTPSTTAAATLVISSLQPSHGIGSGGCFVTSTPMSSPVSIKYDSLGILTPATSPKLIAANIGQESGQQQQQQLLLTAAGGGSTSAVAVASPLPPAQCPPVAMPPALNATGITVAAVPASAAAAAATTGVGEPVGIALVVSSIGGCGELGSASATTVTTTATTSTNNAVVLPASSATSQLYAEET